MFDEQVQAAIKRAADRYQVDAVRLGTAITDESPAQLAAVLHLTEPEAHARFEQIQRILAVNNDWGAGCKLLTDEITDELVAAIDTF